MKKLRVEYYKDKCIGQGNCAAIAPDYFMLAGKKAALKNSKGIDKNTYAIEAIYDEGAAESLISAGKACPVNAIRVIDLEKNEIIVDIKVKEDNIKNVTAEYNDEKEFVLDDAGYFLIRLDRDNNKIEVAFCNEKNKIVLKVTGKKPIEIYQTIINKEMLPIRKDHAAYLGRELQKAYLALTYNLQYVQDDDMDLSKVSLKK